MEGVSSDEDKEVEPPQPPSSRKRPKHGRMKDVIKKLNLQSRETGEPCKCKDKCFDKINEGERAGVLKHVNSLNSHDEVNLYLTGLVTILPIQRHRVNNELDANFRDATYSYCIRVKRNNGCVEEVKVCKNAFISINGISRGKIDYILKQLKETGTTPTYRKGKHDKRPHKLSNAVIEAIRNHIKSFKGRESHYSKKDSNKTYLPSELNVSKMFKMFQEDNENACSLESYRTIFNNEFNISFGYPRTDTCSTCDSYVVKKNYLDKQLAEENDKDKKLAFSSELKQISIDHDLHLAKSQTFYDRKRNAKILSRKSRNKEAMCLDFSKNYPCPNINTNDVYYRRQLSLYAFNIHVLSDSTSIFYVYPQTIANKGSDEVASFLHHFVYNHLDKDVTHLEIFSDSCGGQNKNKTLLRLLHYLVHVENRFEYIKMTFPIRGHSYMECDKNTALVKHTSPAETPQDWVNVFQVARCKPSPFIVEEVNQEMVKDWSTFLDEKYSSKKLPCKTREIKELEVTKAQPSFIRTRETYNGHWNDIVILQQRKGKKKSTPEAVQRRFKEWQRGDLAEGEFYLPPTVYEGN